MASCRSKIRCFFSIMAAQRKQGEPLFFPDHSSLNLSCSDILAATGLRETIPKWRQEMQRLYIWEVVDWCWSFYFFSLSDSFQDCYTWATQFPTEPFTHGWKVWWERNKRSVEPLYLQLRLWICSGIVVDMVFYGKKVAESREYFDVCAGSVKHMTCSLHVFYQFLKRNVSPDSWW